ncbi:hypothetical protein ACFL1Q_00905 [Patescibacteria group bacterium]
MKLIADIPLAPEGGFKGFGPLGLEGKDAASAPSVFTKFISSTIGIMTVIAIIWFVFKFIGGAIGIMSAGGDKQALENGKKSITTGIIGLAIVIASLFVIDLIGNLIGIPDILNVSQLIDNITLD